MKLSNFFVGYFMHILVFQELAQLQSEHGTHEYKIMSDTSGRPDYCTDTIVLVDIGTPTSVIFCFNEARHQTSNNVRKTPQSWGGWL